MTYDLTEAEKEIIINLIGTINLRVPDEVVAVAIGLRRKLTAPLQPPIIPPQAPDENPDA